MNTLKTIAIISTSVIMIWISAVIVMMATQNSSLQNDVAILAFMATLGLSLTAGLLSISSHYKSATSQPAAPQKAKRDAAPAQDARLDLLLALLSTEEREALKHQLLDDLTADGEALTLADLLAAQDYERSHRARH